MTNEKIKMKEKLSTKTQKLKNFKKSFQKEKKPHQIGKLLKQSFKKNILETQNSNEDDKLHVKN